MSVNNLPVRGPLPPTAAIETAAADLTYAVPLEEQDGINWRRVMHALRRHKWLVLAATVLGTAIGVVATRFVSPQYRVEATLWVDQLSRRSTPDYNRGPVRIGQLLEPEGWVDLIKSYQVLDVVVTNLNLFLDLKSPADSAIMKNLRLREEYVPGEYRLALNGDGKSYTLAGEGGIELEHGLLGDSIGKRLGFLWAPRAGSIPASHKVQFRLDTPRDAANRLAKRLDVHMDPDGNFLRVELAGENPRRMAETVNAITARYVQVASELKKEKLVQLTQILDEQLQFQRKKLEEVEGAYQRYRTQTITLPGDRPNADPKGDPLMNRFFDMQVERDQLRRDREAVQRLLGQGADTTRAIGSLTSVASVSQMSPDLTDALKELTVKQAELRALRYRYNDDYPGVQKVATDIATLQRQTIPALGASLVRDISTREAELDRRIATQSGTLRAIPARTMDEERLKRNVTLAEGVYTNLQQRYDEARIEEASTTPDVRVLDPALVPMRPAKNTGPLLILVFFLGSIAISSAGAVLLDRMDPRVRYPEQVSQDMGLTILGAVPHLKTRGGQYRLSRDEAAEVVEALRGVCLNLAHSHGTTTPLMLTVTSPGAGDGKSFLCANMALTFADGGHRTLLLDADLRRGVLHQRFRARRRPGLTDYLRGECTLENLIRPTPFGSLSFMACGSRTHSAPELLASAAMTRLMEHIRANYDVVIVDSPPLSGGIDPCILGALTGNLVMVLRTGFSHRELAEAKLQMLSRFPVRLLGAILNDVPASGSYRYYSYYLPGYEGVEEDSEKRPRELV
jgi:capsular exopolysaccharide synthesis family protein